MGRDALTSIFIVETKSVKKTILDCVMINEGRASSDEFGGCVDYGMAALTFVDSLNSLQSKKEVLIAIQNALSTFGFEHFVMTDLPHPFIENQPHFLLVNLPAGWQEYYGVHKYHLTDPVVMSCRKSSDPFSWDAAKGDPRCEAKSREVMTRARDHGLSNGFTIPIHGLDGLTSCFSMSTSSNSYLDRYTKPAIHLMAIYAFERARQFEAEQAVPPVKLTHREREVLTWAAAGKSAAHIADILHITERTAVAHTVNATHKLGASNKTQAVARALGSKLISL